MQDVRSYSQKLIVTLNTVDKKFYVDTSATKQDYGWLTYEGATAVQLKAKPSTYSPTTSPKHSYC